jgi:hypothetical protein
MNKGLGSWDSEAIYEARGCRLITIAFRVKHDYQVSLNIANLTLILSGHGISQILPFFSVFPFNHSTGLNWFYKHYENKEDVFRKELKRICNLKNLASEMR